MMLHKRAPFEQRACIELQEYVRAFGIEDKSLQKIYGILFGEKISKSQRLTNWEAETLTEPQKLYAATDAWACLNIYNLPLINISDPTRLTRSAYTVFCLKQNKQ